jgi:GNAT superfamily N-acetyltransferase
VRICPVTELDSLREFHLVEAAAHDHDFVALPADPVEELVPLLQGGEQSGEHVLLFLAREGSTPVGILTVRYFLLDNLGSANVEIAVHPAHRGRGHGRRLLEHGLADVRARGRSRVFLEAPHTTDGGDGPGARLLRSAGARPVLEDVRRLLDLSRHPVGEPMVPPAGYRLVQWLDRAPEELVDGAARLAGRMTLDAPMGQMDYEQEKWDAARYRAKEEHALARNRLRLATAVVHEGSGAVAGITDIGVNRDHQRVAYQWDTIVDPDHRGHRLGWVLKTWNHRQLVDTCPDVAYVNTWNAASNTFMVAVNDALGFEPAEHWTEWQLELAPAGPPSSAPDEAPSPDGGDHRQHDA